MAGILIVAWDESWRESEALQPNHEKANPCGNHGENHGNNPVSCKIPNSDKNLNTCEENLKHSKQNESPRNVYFMLAPHVIVFILDGSAWNKHRFWMFLYVKGFFCDVSAWNMRLDGSTCDRLRPGWFSMTSWMTGREMEVSDGSTWKGVVAMAGRKMSGI